MEIPPISLVLMTRIILEQTDLSESQLSAVETTLLSIKDGLLFRLATDG